MGCPLFRNGGVDLTKPMKYAMILRYSISEVIHMGR